MSVSNSVWFDYEDDVLRGNKPCDVVDLDVFSDNIISSEFPDDDEELFDVNEFIDVNKYTDTGMGLNFHARQD